MYDLSMIRFSKSGMKDITWKDFELDSSNQAAVEISREFFASREGPKVFFLSGPAGDGKNQLVGAAVNEFLEKSPETQVVYFPVTRLGETITTWPGFAIFDDLEHVWEDPDLYARLNRQIANCFENRTDIVLIADHFPTEFKEQDLFKPIRIYSASIQAPTEELIRRVLEKGIQHDHLPVTVDEVLSILPQPISLRSATGCLSKIKMAKGTGITRDLEI